jgi:hypothetical protein
MTREQEALRVNVGAQCLGKAEDDAARQRAPQAPSTAYYPCLESKNELQRSGIRVEVRSQREKQTGEPDGD